MKATDETHPIMLTRDDPCPVCGVSEQKGKALDESFLWLYNVLVSNMGKSGEEPSLEEREAAVKQAQTILWEVQHKAVCCHQWGRNIPIPTPKVVWEER